MAVFLGDPSAPLNFVVRRHKRAKRDNSRFWPKERTRQMTTSGSDFDAAKAVAEQLKGMEKERQQRILRWVAESLSLDLGIAPATERRTAETTASRGATSPHEEVQRHRRPADIKSFVDSKRPKSDVQFAAVVAYYYRFEASAENRSDSIDAEVLQQAARLAGRRRPPNPLAILNNAKTLGYLDSSERGQFRINSVGENLVAMTLPGTEPERTRKKARTSKPRKARPKKR